jgi:hypothetical protein
LSLNICTAGDYFFGMIKHFFDHRVDKMLSYNNHNCFFFISGGETITVLYIRYR